MNGRHNSRRPKTNGPTPDLLETLGRLVEKHDDDALAAAFRDLLTQVQPREVVTRAERVTHRKKPLIAMRTHEVAAMLEAVELPHPYFAHRGPTWTLMRRRLRIAMVILDRTGVRVSEMLDLVDSDLNPHDKTIVIRNGKGGKRRDIGMDAWGWEELELWRTLRNAEIRPGYLIPVLRGRAGGCKWADCDVRRQLKALALRAGLTHTAHPHAWRHGFAVRYWRAHKDLVSLQYQLGHSDLSITQVYLGSIDPTERLAPIINAPAPVIELPHPKPLHDRERA